MTEKKNYSHLTMDERLEIQNCLNCGVSFKAIAMRIGKSPHTVSREVKRHITVNPTSVKHFDKDGKPVVSHCPLLLKPPFVCNGCKKKSCACSFDKHLYYAKKAQAEYDSTLSESREGIPLAKESFYEVDRIVSDAVGNGQHLYHVMQTNDLGISTATLYRHVKKGYLSIAAVDLPRAVKFKPRKSDPRQTVPKALKIGRNYDDFQLHISENDISVWVEMDTVIGRIGGKVIMTFDFTFCNFMFGLLLDDKQAASARTKIVELKRTLKRHGLSFGEFFAVIVTDNGTEFSDVFSIEQSLDGTQEARLFFCDPFQSSQKPHVEKNHTLFRDIVPKGTSFDDFTQETVNLIFSHVNGVKRKIYGGKSPYDLFVFTFGKLLADILGIEKVAPEQVIQSPKLLTKLH